MTAHQNKGSDPTLTEMRVDYWKKRLDHTLNHNQTNSRLIYLIDGAVLALLYFSVQTLGATRPVILVISIPTALLAALNLLHARFVRIQASWYSGIDTKLQTILQEEQVEHPVHRRWLASTHGIYRLMHFAIAVFLLIASMMMFYYGHGGFSNFEIQPKDVLYE